MKDKIGLYVHLPFCKGKCPYCAFYSLNINNELKENYISSLFDLMDFYAKMYKVQADTLYIGGGTPSLFSSNELAAIVQKAGDNFFIENQSEISLEINPADAAGLDFSVLHSCGINRLSVGMQSACEEELKILGRRHNVEDVKNCVRQANSAGINNISLDLIIAIPKQDESKLEYSINFCDYSNVQHVSAYILTLEEGTHFYKNKEKFDFLSEERQAKLYLFACEKLESCGLKQYEISSFAREGFKSQHNLKYWKNKEYIGLGPSAHSYFQNSRFYYFDDINEFIKKPVAVHEPKSNINKKEEFAMLSLRLSEGLNYKEFEKYFSSKVPNEWIEKAKILQDYNLTEVTNDGFSLSKKGFLLSNSVISEIIS